MTGRPQPLQDIEERIELLKTTLGLFPPGEPGPIARELCELGGDILMHRLAARGAAPAASALDGLAEQAARQDASLAAARDICREMLRLSDRVAAAPDDAETGARLAALADAAGRLYALGAADS